MKVVISRMNKFNGASHLVSLINLFPSDDILDVFLNDDNELGLPCVPHQSYRKSSGYVLMEDIINFNWLYKTYRLVYVNEETYNRYLLNQDTSVGTYSVQSLRDFVYPVHMEIDYLYFWYDFVNFIRVNFGDEIYYLITTRPDGVVIEFIQEFD